MSWLFAAVVAPTSLRFHVSSDGSQRQWKIRIERPIQQLGETFPRISQVLHVWTIWIWGKGWSKGKGGKGGKGQGFGKAAQKAGGKSGTQTKGKNNGGWGNGYRAAPNDFGCVLDLNYGLEEVLRLGGADSDHDRKRFIQKLAHTRGCWSCNVFFHLHFTSPHLLYSTLFAVFVLFVLFVLRRTSLQLISLAEKSLLMESFGQIAGMEPMASMPRRPKTFAKAENCEFFCFKYMDMWLCASPILSRLCRNSFWLSESCHLPQIHQHRLLMLVPLARWRLTC